MQDICETKGKRASGEDFEGEGPSGGHGHTTLTFQSLEQPESTPNSALGLKIGFICKDQLDLALAG